MNVQIRGNKKEGFAICSNQQFSEKQIEWLNANFNFEPSDYGQGYWGFSIDEINKIELAREYFKSEWGFQVHTSIQNLKSYKEMQKKKEMTPAQRERQKSEYRENGKYAKVHPCYVCGKSAGVDYFSHQDTDGLINDELLCLCGKCMKKLSQYDGKTAVKIAFGDS